MINVSVGEVRRSRHNAASIYQVVEIVGESPKGEVVVRIKWLHDNMEESTRFVNDVICDELMGIGKVILK